MSRIAEPQLADVKLYALRVQVRIEETPAFAVAAAALDRAAKLDHLSCLRDALEILYWLSKQEGCPAVALASFEALAAIALGGGFLPGDRALRLLMAAKRALGDTVEQAPAQDAELHWPPPAPAPGTGADGLPPNVRRLSMAWADQPD